MLEFVFDTGVCVCGPQYAICKTITVLLTHEIKDTIINYTQLPEYVVV